MTYERGKDRIDFTMHEGELLGVRVTIDDPNQELVTLDGTTIVWTAIAIVDDAKDLFTIEKTTGDGGIEILDDLVFVAHIVEEDTLNLIPFRRVKMFRETKITKDGELRFTRFLNNNSGYFEILQAI
jgi:hypothetical protein